MCFARASSNLPNASEILAMLRLEGSETARGSMSENKGRKTENEGGGWRASDEGDTVWICSLQVGYEQQPKLQSSFGAVMAKQDAGPLFQHLELRQSSREKGGRRTACTVSVSPPQYGTTHHQHDTR
eukprot:1227738-Rhodomonas_salina.2